MYKYKKLILSLVIISLTVTGCKKDPEDVSPVDTLTTANFPKTISDVQSLVTQGYANFHKDKFLYGFEILTKEFANSGHQAFLAYPADADWNQLAKNDLSASNQYTTNLWKGLYIGVKNANVAIEGAASFEAKYMKTGEEAKVNALRGEAYFLRAYYYFILESFFGEAYIGPNGTNRDKMGVPLITRIATSLEETRNPRASVGEVWDQIIADLKISKDYLKGVAREGNERGRVSEWTAKSLLGKAYVFTHQWDSAAVYLKDVIDNSGKRLMLFNKYKDAFNANANNEYNEESLFELNVERISDGTGIFVPGTPSTNLTTSAGLVWSPSILDTAGAEKGYGSDDLGYGNEFVHDKNLQRFGYDIPIYTLVANPNYDPTKPKSRTNPLLVPTSGYIDSSFKYRNEKIADPRLYVSALQPWIDSCGDRKGNVKVPVSRCHGIADDPTKYYGWPFKKYTTIDKSLYEYNSCDGANYYLLRLADVYLLYAEARMHIGGNNDVEGLRYLNMVHQRAYGGPSASDYTSFTSRTKAAANDVNLANNPLAFERHAELFGEGHWWFDVCRWRIGAAEAAYYARGLSLSSSNADIIWNDISSYTYPIPTKEISANPTLIGHQNPGY